MFEAYVGMLKCYSFRTMVSDFYIDDVYEFMPNIDSSCLIAGIDSILHVTSSNIDYNPEVAAFPFKNVLHDYLEIIEENCSDEE